MNVIEIEDVTKAYKEKIASNHINLNIPEGIIFGLLGPNGAGKTTLIRMITRITVPDSGYIRFKGENLAERHQRLIGYLPEERGLYKKMKVDEQLLYLLQLKGMTVQEAKQAMDVWLKRFQLENWRNSKVQELSKGMQQKVQIISTIAHNPPVLILDEPFSGLDPVNTQLIEEVIMELKESGTTIIFSTHRMEQVEQLCERIALVNEGQVVLEDDIHVVRRKYRTFEYNFEFEEEVSKLQLPDEIVLIKQMQHSITIKINEANTIPDLFQFFSNQTSILKFEEIIPGLRDIFIQIVHPEKENNE